MDLTVLTLKKQQLDALRPLPEALLRNLESWFRVELTYTSNALEGNTLSRAETALVVEKGLTTRGKTLVEHLEATNHARALDWVTQRVQQAAALCAEQDILHLHSMILRGIDDAHAGCYRAVPVRISGSAVVLPNPRKVPDAMAAFADWLGASVALHPVARAIEAHYRLVTIHPFVDGSGRTARLLMNMLLQQAGYVAAIIRPRDRLAYITSLEKAQLGGAKDDYERVMLRAIERSLDMVLQAARGQNVEADAPVSSTLLKIGALARQAGVSVPTIRHWTKEGLLSLAEVTASGYQLYGPEMVERCAAIQALQARRFTLAEIKREFAASDGRS